MSSLSYAAWQTCLPKNLPTLFYAFDANDSQTARVAGFRITDQTKLATLLSSNPTRLRIRLGVDTTYDFSEIPSTPAIQFYLEGLDASGSTATLEFAWDPNPPFLEKDAYGPNSGTNEIPPDGAILFARAWMETPFSKIGDAFEGADSKNLVQRVKYYTFQEEETTSIITQLEEGLLGGDMHICLYLGNSIPVSGHPFGFRPVIEIRPIDSPAPKSLVNGSRKSTFFDFSSPCPPVCSQ
ncbi:hypothetical protein [Lewinella cohaerens]|uniref:hypothetical protein n=1 Tax=Lewinella cohaerens TaxID=70995 RepID=UPI0003A9B0D5|nr:hypothetical protein [Lewinella cohaerens]